MPHRQGGFVRSLNAAALKLAGSISTPENRVRRLLSPLYSSLLDILGGRRGYPAEINGHVFRIDPRFRWAAWTHHEQEVARYLSERITPGQVCFDVGANIGLYVLQLARWSAPDGRIVAFEPNPSTVSVLRRHVVLNGLDPRVVIVPKGVGAVSGDALLYDDTAGSGLSRIGGPHPGIDVPVTPRTIPVTTIDDYCRETGTIPDWIVIDVEGYEFEVLQGAATTLRNHAPRVVMEIHRHVVSAQSREAGERLLDQLRLKPVAIQDIEGRDESFVSLERM